MNSSSCQKPLLANSPEVKNFPPSVFLSRVLLRVRMLYYLRQEVIGDQADKILEGADSRLVQAYIFVVSLRELIQAVRKHHGLCSSALTDHYNLSPFLRLEYGVCPLCLGVCLESGKETAVFMFKRYGLSYWYSDLSF